MRATPARVVRATQEWHALWWPGIRPLAVGAAVCTVSLFGFALLADEVVEDGRDRYDRALEIAVRDEAYPFLTDALRLLTHLGSTVVTGALCLLMAAWLVGGRRRLAAVLTMAAWTSGQIAVAAIKAGLHRARPDLLPPLVHADGYSFPSAHAFSTVVAYGLLAALLAARRHGRARLVPWLGWAALVGVVGYSRIYLGAHYATDVLGSVLLGGAWLQGVLLVIELVENPRRFLPPHPKRRRGRRPAAEV